MEFECRRNLGADRDPPEIDGCDGTLRKTGKLKNIMGEEYEDDYVLVCDKCGSFWKLNLIEGPTEMVG